MEIMVLPAGVLLSHLPSLVLFPTALLPLSHVTSNATESEGVTGCNIGAILLEYIKAPSMVAAPETAERYRKLFL